MSFRSIFQDMRDEIGNISLRKTFSLSSSSHRASAVHHGPGPSCSRFAEDCSSDWSWVNLPPELLRDVLVRVEEKEEGWPGRKDVVSCAGVCKTWRGIVKEIVKVPEVSRLITFPVSLKQPGPRELPVQCFIKRNRNTHTYYLYLGLTQALTDDGKFLLAARKVRRPTCTDYVISLDKNDFSKGSSTYVGKLRSNFLGTKFTVYDAHPPHKGAILSRTRSMRTNQVTPRPPPGNFPVCHLTYQLNVLGSRGPRRMNFTMDSIPLSSISEGGTAPTQTEFPLTSIDTFANIPFFRSKSSRLDPSSSVSLSSSSSIEKDEEERKLILRNKSPRWHEQLQCWCLNFRGRVTVASVKNFQLVASSSDEISSSTNQEQDSKVILQFGKVGKDLFTMDYCYPVSAFQAFAICLSSFDTKIACE